MMVRNDAVYNVIKIYAGRGRCQTGTAAGVSGGRLIARRSGNMEHPSPGADSIIQITAVGKDAACYDIKTLREAGRVFAPFR
jgi:hypothetical protein